MREFMSSAELIQALASPDHKITLADLQFLYYRGLVERAHQSAYAAATTIVPTPMYVEGYAPVMDGLCGFAWVTIQRNGPFWRWACKHSPFEFHPRTKGAAYWISDFNQSHARKAAYAKEFARVLREGGVPAYADSRLD